MPSKEEKLHLQKIRELSCPKCLLYPCGCTGGGDDNATKEENTRKDESTDHRQPVINPLKEKQLIPIINIFQPKSDEDEEEREQQISTFQP